MMSSHTIAIADNIAVLLVLLAFGIIVITLQVFLSRTAGKWPGVVMPIIAGGISIMACVQLALRAVASRSFSGFINGVYVEYTTSTASIVWQVVAMFAICNIATCILIAIYAIYRRKKSGQHALKIMNVQDLG